MPVAESITLDPTYGIGVFSASQNGVLVYQSGSRTKNELLWLDGDGRSLGAAGQPDSYDQLDLSPDGTRAAVTIDDADGVRDVWVVDLEQGTRARLTFSTKEAPAIHSEPLWSPDGREIVFVSNQTGSNDLYRKPADGIGETQLLLSAPEDLWCYDWSPDGKYVVYGHERPEHNGAEDLFVVPVSGEGEPIRLLDTPFNEWPAKFSPDGRWLAYDSPESGRREIYVVPFPGLDGRWQVSTEGGRFPRWSPDGRRLYYWQGGKMMAVPLQASGGTLQIGAQEPVLDLGWGANFISYDVHPDGQRFLMLATDTSEGPASLSLFMNWKTELESR
jgi:Tol biopolymer transport system component